MGDSSLQCNRGPDPHYDATSEVRMNVVVAYTLEVLQKTTGGMRALEQRSKKLSVGCSSTTLARLRGAWCKTSIIRDTASAQKVT